MSEVRSHLGMSCYIGEPVYADNCKVVYKFEGEPATEKGHQFEGIEEDKVCTATIPFQIHEYGMPYTGEELAQCVMISNVAVKDNKAPVDQAYGINTTKLGKLTIGCYCLIDGAYKQVLSWEAEKACLVNSSNSGTDLRYAIVGGNVDLTIFRSLVNEEAGDYPHSWSNDTGKLNE